MSKSKRLPDYVLRIATYAELAQYAAAFARAHLNLLFLFGHPGLGKSRCVREAIGGEVCWIEGNASPFGIYTAAYEHRDQPIVLDDVDGLYRDRNGVRLLKSLCQTEPLKRLSWNSNAVALQQRGIPRDFTTRSRVVIIANEWKSLNADVAALEDRGHLLHFDPDPLEVHRHAAGWFGDQEVFDWIGDRLHLVKQPSLRLYTLAAELKPAGLDWQAAVLSRCLTGAALEVARLKADARFATEEDRARAFVEAGHGCRATYFNHARKLRGTPAPRMRLQQASPLSWLAFLHGRHRRLGTG